MADEANTACSKRTEDWNTFPWKDIQRNVCRLQRRIYQAARPSAYDKGPYPEEPREGKALTRGSGVAAGWATAPPTVTLGSLERTERVLSQAESYLWFILSTTELLTLDHRMCGTRNRASDRRS